MQFAKEGYSTTVLLHKPEDDSDIPDSNICVLNTDSRAASFDEAYQYVFDFSNAVNKHEYEIIYKKIDSTLRGNIGIEIDAMMDSFNLDAAVIVPAYPGNGRKTIGGYHLINGLLLEDSDISNDPTYPVKQSFIPEIIKKQSKREVELIDLRKIRSNSLVSEIESSLEKGKELLIFDCFNYTDMQAITTAVNSMDKKILWVGSAGLTHALSEGLIEGTPYTSDDMTVLSNHEDPILIVAGSVSKVTRQQIAVLRNEGLKVCELDPSILLEEGITSDILSSVKKHLEKKGNLVITTIQDEDSAVRLEEWTKKNNVNPRKVGELIARNLGELASKLVHSSKVAGLVLTGGDIAHSTCSWLEIEALQIVEEIEEGIPLSIINGGKFRGLPVVTKAGAFGNDYSLLNSIKRLSGKEMDHKKAIK
ncbi:four-carbon acid sugar kinase family protein [Pseudalkalibacillus caeni]|uniref:Four-carbon acid sugar kinase family protein n=1 Tax=Exobacillus caeni TaxID=2574798 RepID=A0A5R9F7X2_9BACL|nr:four-carbon acid sugar kinase family protein [Pseudalkalibacillus caeni]